MESNQAGPSILTWTGVTPLDDLTPAVVVSEARRADTDITTVTSDAGTAILTWTGATGIQADLTVDTLQCEGGREGGRG